MNSYAASLVLLLSVNLAVLSGHVAGSKVLQIRGIPISKSSLYSPERDFECLDGSLLIPFSHVNDDYCDCADGSDEPGTPACTNGSFYCENSGHKSRYIPSTWVNDGICDCCDASDEYASAKECPNNCNDLGREARIERQKAEELVREGSKIRAEMTNRGKKLKTEYQSKVVKLRGEFEEANMIKKEKEALKTRAEEREGAALEKYKPPEPEQPTPTEQEADENHVSEAENYFKLLDSDASGTVSLAELQTRVTFDKDKDGAVTEEEALFFLSNNKEVNLQEFIDFAWANIKPFLMMEEGLFKPDDKDEFPEEEPEAPEEGAEHDKEEEDEQEEEETVGEDQDKSVEEAQIQYDEETQVLVDEANNARERYQESEKAVNDLQVEIRKLEDKLDRDYGTDEEFAPLDGECFEYTDLEYVYTLCIFGKATQRSKSGGSDITLGHWHEWMGPEGSKYSKMRYDRGITCWNGPDRTTTVTVVCGKENKLVSVSEPSRCEYAMEFATPAMCKLSMDSGDTHDEL